jgi:hypothetical protein
MITMLTLIFNIKKDKMKKTLIKTSSIMLGLTVLLGFSSCLKDSRFVDFAAVGTTVEIPLSGKSQINALTEATDVITRQFAVNVASPKPLSKDLTVTLGFDAAALAAYNASQSAVVFEPMPTDAYSLDKATVVIPAGTRTQIVTLTIQKTKLDPSKSYLLPISITDAQGETINGNYHTKYYSAIGNDFAGVYFYEYRRFQNGTGPGAGAIPSRGEGSAPDITNAAGSETVITPVTGTEFKMETGYNGQHVQYDVRFTRTVSGSTVTYSNWTIRFLPDDLQKWTDAGIENKVAPKFTLPPPATNADPKFFELNYVSGGASGRYIDDTYKKKP